MIGSSLTTKSELILKAFPREVRLQGLRRQFRQQIDFFLSDELAWSILLLSLQASQITFARFLLGFFCKRAHHFIYQY